MTEPYTEFQPKQEFLDFVHAGKIPECEFLTKNQRFIVLERVLKGKTFRAIGDELKMSGTNARVQFMLSHKKIIQGMRDNEPLTPETLIRRTSIPRKYLLIDIGIEKLCDLNNFSTSKLLKHKGMGRKVIDEIEKFIEPFGIRLNYDYDCRCDELEKISFQYKIDLVLSELKEIKKNNLKNNKENLLDFENMIGECSSSSLGSFIMEEASPGDVFVIYYRPKSDTDFQIYEVRD